MKQYFNVKRQYNLTFCGIDDVGSALDIYSKSFKNVTRFTNNKRFRFDLNGIFNSVQLGNNAKVSVKRIYVPSNNNGNDHNTMTIIRLRGVSDNVYDTEIGMNNNPIIAYTKTTNVLIESQENEISTFRIPSDFLNKGYVEFDLYIEDSALNKDIVFDEPSFIVSLLIFEEDFEETKELINAPHVVNNPPQKPFNNFYPNYNNS